MRFVTGGFIRRGAGAAFVFFFAAGLGAAGCATGGAAGRPRATAIHWLDGAPGDDATLCASIDSVTPSATGWWLSGPGCLLEAVADAPTGRYVPFTEADWQMDRVDGLVAAGDGSVWAAGRQRNGEAVRAVLGRWTDAGTNVGSPDRWDLEGAIVNGFTTAADGTAWAVGRRLGTTSGFLVARWADGRWVPLATTGLDRGELLAIDFSPDGCAWMVGRDDAGGGVLLRFDGRKLRQERLDPEDGVPSQVVAASCGDVWIAGHSVIRYAHGHREEIGFGGVELSGLAACPDGDLLLVGERRAHEPEMRGRHVGFSFRVRNGSVVPLPVPLPFVVGDWRLADVTCDGRGAWTVGTAIARLADGRTERRALTYRLGPEGWQYRGWAAGREGAP